MSEATSSLKAQFVEEIFQRVAGDLSMITDRDLNIVSVEMESLDHRPAGEGSIHISLRLAFEVDDEIHHGCLVVPLRQAITLAAGLMMMPTEAIAAVRDEEAIDATTKEAMIEVGTFVCGAADAGLRALGLGQLEVHFEGCQGVKPDVRPALVYEEGAPLVVGRAAVSMADFETDTMLLILPETLIPA